MTYHFDVDPEGFVRYGGACICGAVYTYAGHPEPGAFDPYCPVHGDPAAYEEFLMQTTLCRPGHTHDALCDPDLAVPRVGYVRPIEEVVRRNNERFLAERDQQVWRDDLFRRVAAAPLPARDDAGRFQARTSPTKGKKGGKR